MNSVSCLKKAGAPMRVPLTAFLLFVFSLAYAQQKREVVIAVPEHPSGLEVCSHAYYYRDASGNMSPLEIISLPLSAFTTTKNNVVNFGNTKDVIWTRFSMTSTVSQVIYLHIEPPLANKYRFFTMDSAGAFHEQHAGYDFSRSEREPKVSGYYCRVELPAHDTVRVLLNSYSALPNAFGITISDMQSSWEEDETMTLINGIYIGIMLIMILYNIFLFVSNHERVYIYYTLYILFSTIFNSFANGSVYHMPEFLYTINSVNMSTIPLLFGFFGMLFSVNYLELKKNAPRLFMLNSILYGCVAINFVVGFFDAHLAISMVQINGVLLSLFCIRCGQVVWQSGFKPARFYMAGFGLYMAGLLTYITVGVLNIPTPFPSYYILMSGSAVEAIILSFAIGEKLNDAIRESKSANDRALSAAMDNEKLIREQNVVLEEKVIERTAEISHQKAIIEEKNKDILDSIHYAKRIQRALLASDTLLAKNLPEYFVLYKPKDIVSGDFYWADELLDGKFLLLTGDCTGHGVPGAFMSLLNISIMHEVTNGMHIHRPDLILNKQREAIIMSLNPEGADEISKDGMDCVLCSFDLKNNRMEFSCANNPLWLIRNRELIEYKADKQPIGMHEGDFKNFTLHELDLKKGDVIYTFTDGYADQFGGTKGKKFKYSQLKELLLSIHQQPMCDQSGSLSDEFEKWKGDLVQLDDVLLIGIRI